MKTIRKHNLNSSGFTIIELVIATTVFSVILLICTAGLLIVGRSYYKGITIIATQEVSRSVMQQISEDFQLSGGVYKPVNDGAAGLRGFCIGSHLYSYRLNQKINTDGSGHALVVRDYPGCDILPPSTPDDINASSSPDPTKPWRELLGSNMRITKLDITSTDPQPPQSVTISINVISGDDDLINAGLCNSGAGSQYCANSPLTSYVVRKLR